MIRTILIDDEPDARESLRYLLQRYCPDVEIVGEAASAAEGKLLLEKESPNMVFLDVQMPRQSGFDLLEDLSVINFQVIFVTAFEQYAIKAIRFSALDYLLKPVDVDDLQNALQRYRLRQEEPTDHRDYQHRIKHFQQADSRFQKLAIPGKGETSFLPLPEILYCEADGSYTKVHQVNGHIHLLSRPLKEIEVMLSEHGFFRVHHSFLVNLEHIQKYIKGEGGYVILTGNKKIDVSRRKKEEFLRRLGL